MLKRAGRAPSRAVGAYSGGAGGTCREAPISAERCAARREPRDARGLLGSSPHAPPVWGAEHSPELIHHPHQHEERVLADALLECVSERRELLVRGGRVKESTVLRGRGAWRQWGLPSPSPCLLCRRCGREAAAAGTQGTGRHGTRAGGSAAKRDSAQGPDSSQPPPLLPAELSPPHRPGLPGSVQPGVPVGLPETPRAASLSSGRERWSQTTCPNPDLGNVCGPWGLSPLLTCSHHLPTLQALEERLLWPHAALRHPPPPAPPGVTVSAVLLCSPSTYPPPLL